MDDILISRKSSRRELLKAGGWMAGAGLFAGLVPKEVMAEALGRGVRAAQQSQAGNQGAGAASGAQTAAQGTAAPVDRVAQMRAQASSAPLQNLKLRENIF